MLDSTKAKISEQISNLKHAQDNLNYSTQREVSLSNEKHRIQNSFQDINAHIINIKQRDESWSPCSTHRGILGILNTILQTITCKMFKIKTSSERIIDRTDDVIAKAAIRYTV